jgi:hopanoid C-3 methylase
MKILLINPNNCGKSIPEERYGIESIKMIFCGEPLALETIAGNLDGHDVGIADLKMDPLALADGNLDFTPDLVGITGVTCEANTVLAIARDIKERFRVPVVVGGHHASCDPHFFRQPCVDFIVVGLGKLSFRELVDALEAGRPVRIPGIYCCNNGTTPDTFMPRHYTEDDLVDQKAPRYDLVARHRERYIMGGAGGRVGFVATAAGCPHGCSFCSIANLTGARYLAHTNQAVLRDMALLGDVPVIRLVDANTFGNIQAAEALAREIMGAGIQKRLVADVRADTVVRHPELFRLWRQAGLTTVVIGFEEIDDQKLRLFNKKSSHEIHLEAIGILKSLGIRIVGDFIISPEYEHADFQRLMDFVETSGIDVPIPAVLAPLPGTPLYQRMEPQITVHDLDYYTFTNAVMPTRMEEHEFYKCYAGMLRRFLGHVHE